jgi:hypothetical protein
MNDAQIAYFSKLLEEQFFAYLPPANNHRGFNEEQIHKNNLSRSLAAFAIQRLVNITPQQACDSVIDGFQDNGIDAIYFDPKYLTVA